MTTIINGTLVPADHTSALAWLNWAVAREAAAPTDSKGIQWSLAFSYEGVTWGKFIADASKWQWGSDFFPDNCPTPTLSKLTEIRLFGENQEMHIWRSGEEWRGRMLKDAISLDERNEFRPADERRLIRADRMFKMDPSGFSCVSDNTGVQQIFPMECRQEDFLNGYWPLRLKIRNYFSEDRESGAARITATRLVGLKKEVKE